MPFQKAGEGGLNAAVVRIEMSLFATATIAIQSASLAATYWAPYVQAGVAGLVRMVKCLA